MAKIIQTHLRSPSDFDEMEREWVYNGLDCCVTAEVLDALLPQLDQNTSATYDFSRRLQGPVLEMGMRGVLVDKARRQEVIDQFYDTLDILETQLMRIVLDGVGLVGFNWRSNLDLQHLFYERLKLPPVMRSGRVTCDRAARDKLEQYLIARPIIRHLNLMWDIGKKISVLKTETDPDGRIRTSYNIAGTSTGRFSSSFSEFGTGGNLQNIEESLRSIFIAEPGYRFAKFDAKQIQSRIVGAIEYNVLDDASYLDASESADLHTLVCKLTWPHLAWTGNPKRDKAIAETLFHRHFTHRDLAKKLGHGSNFDGQPPNLSSQTGVPLPLVKDFQPKYFQAFPVHKQWHEWTAAELRRCGKLISLCGRKRHFWGRRNAHETLREALAYTPQSTESWIVNNGMLNVWHARDALLVFQDHDAVVVTYPEEREAVILPKILRQLEVPMTLNRGRQFLVPYDCKVGWNRGNASATNPDGLLDWTGQDQRRRTPTIHWLDRKRA